MNILKGFIVGASMLVPGFSGGTMAMILGIYDKLIASLSGILSFQKNENYFIKNKSNFLTVILFSIGALLGMIIVAKPLSVLIDKFFTISCFFFMGAALVYLISMIPEGFFSDSENNRSKNFTYFILALAGFISAIALILPGISVSYMFLLLGIYQETINAIQSFYIPYLIPLCFGLILGIVLTTKILEYWMKHYVKSSYLIISGFVLGSIMQVFPGLPKKPIEWILCPLLFVSAYLLIRLLQRFDPDAIDKK